MVGMTDTLGTSNERADAVHLLEAEFGELGNRFRRLMHENAQRVSPGMLPAAYKVFTTIARRDQVTPSALADHMLMDRGQLSRTLRELEELGLITRSPDPADGRSSLLSATPEGHARLAAARAPQEGLLTDKLAEWSVEDIRSLTRLLHALTAGIQPGSGEPSSR